MIDMKVKDNDNLSSIQFEKLQTMNAHSSVYVHYDIFCDLFPEIMKATSKADRTQIVKIYQRYFNINYGSPIRPSDTFRMRIDDIILYFKCVQNFLPPDTFQVDALNKSDIYLWQ